MASKGRLLEAGCSDTHLCSLSTPILFPRRYSSLTQDVDGALLSGDSDLENPAVHSPSPQESNTASAGKGSKKEARQYHSLERQAKAIASIFPGARSVAVVPLWDSVKDRWFSGGILWTNSPTRILTVEGELSYLRAFGTTLMGEVARLNALASDKSKSECLPKPSYTTFVS